MKGAVWFAFVLAAAAGCAEKRERVPSGTGGTGTGGSGNPSSGGDSGTGARCEQEDTRFSFLLTTPSDATLYDRARLTLRGIVRTIDGGGLSVEGCGTIEPPLPVQPGAGGEGGGANAGGASGDGCQNGIWTIDVVAPDFVVPVEAGMHVSVDFDSSCQPFSGCNEELVIHDELANGESLLLAMRSESFGGSSGDVETVFDWPVTMELVDLMCSFSVPNAGSQRTTWTIRVAPRDVPASALLLHMGESGELSLGPAGDGTWLARNVNSFDRGGFDATTSFGFYLAKMR